MISAAIICFGYVGVLFLISRKFGVKYPEIIKSTDNIRRGLFLPIGLASALLTLFAWYFNWFPDVMSFAPRLEQPILWIVPALFIVGACARLMHARWEDFNRKGIFYLLFGTLFVGFSEELLVRGMVTTVLFESGYSLFMTGLLSSLLFGLAHGINFFNGQDAKITIQQMLTTTLMGINFYVCFVISGTLWVPILIHFLHDFTLLLQGGSVNSPKSEMNLFDVGIIIGLMVFAPVSLLYLQ